MSRYARPRTLISWLGNPYLRAAKVAAILSYEQGLRGKKLAAAVRRIFPHLDDEAGLAVSDNTIAQRGDRGSHIPSEHYSANVDLAVLAVLVQAKIATGRPWPRVRGAEAPWPIETSNEIPF